MPSDKQQDKNPQGRPRKMIEPIPGKFEDIIKALVKPVKGPDPKTDPKS